MNRIVFATGNENKMKEIREILGDLNTEIISLKQQDILEKIHRMILKIKL